MESVEVSARTVDEAVQQALDRLGKTRDEVEITVLSEGHRQILGFVRGENARVKVTVLESAPVAPAPTRAAPAPRPTVSRAPRSRPEPEQEPVQPARPVSTEPARPLKVEGPAIVAKDTMEELLDNMGIDAAVLLQGRHRRGRRPDRPGHRRRRPGYSDRQTWGDPLVSPVPGQPDGGKAAGFLGQGGDRRGRLPGTPRGVTPQPGRPGRRQGTPDRTDRGPGADARERAPDSSHDAPG